MLLAVVPLTRIGEHFEPKTLSLIALLLIILTDKFPTLLALFGDFVLSILIVSVYVIKCFCIFSHIAVRNI